MTDLFSEMERRYREGDLPWDDPLPPPEVIELAGQLPPGRALDLGCGAGRACIYLAQQGWACDGVDFVPQAIALARTRARAAGVANRIHFHIAAVTQLDFLHPPYDLAIDVGCLHAQQGDDLRIYAAEVSWLLRPGAHYLLFARLLDDPTQSDMRGLPEQAIHALLSPTFTFDHVVYGNTSTDDAAWRSAWFWMRRKE